jgi:hypothetical protein
MHLGITIGIIEILMIVGFGLWVYFSFKKEEENVDNNLSK